MDLRNPRLAKLPLPTGGFWEDLCFLAQQAAELAIKAVYQQQGWLFPNVHDLDRLLNGLASNGLTIPSDVQRADELSVYAAQARYPGFAPVATQADHADAVIIADAVVAWAKTQVP